MIRQRNFEQQMERFETLGNSISFYLLLLIIGLGIWIMTPLAPSWRPDGTFYGYLALGFTCLTMLHAILWFLITRESLKLPKKFRIVLATAIRFVRPLHMMTGILALGVVLVHAYAFVKTGFDWGIQAYTGLAAAVILAILTIDGIGLMASPFLSRKVHRWVAAAFVAGLGIHLWVM